MLTTQAQEEEQEEGEERMSSVWQWWLWGVDTGRDDMLRGANVGLESGEPSKIQIWKSSERKIDSGHFCTNVMPVRPSWLKIAISAQLPSPLPPYPSFIFSIALTMYIYFTCLFSPVFSAPHKLHLCRESMVFHVEYNGPGLLAVHGRCSEDIRWVGKWRTRRGRDCSLMALVSDRVGWTEGQRRGDPGGNRECLRSRRQ